MEVFGFTIARTTALERSTEGRVKSALSLLGISGSRGWWPLIQELTTGGWQRNEEIQPETVLSNPTLFACITLIAGDIAKLGLKLQEQDADGVWIETESPAFSPFLRKPNHYQSRIDFYEWWLISKLVHGNTYVLKQRDDRGVVTAGYILDPHRVKPLVAPDGSVFYQLYQDELVPIDDSVVVPAREMFHDVICPLFHPLCGVSPIYAAGFPALQGLNIRNQSNKFFTNGSKPGGILLVPGEIDQDQADRMKEKWTTNFSGDNVGSIAVLSGGMTYVPMAVTAEQSQLIEQLRMTDEDICKCFHMPRHKVGVGPDPTYNNIEALNLQYYADCLQKHIEKLELKLNEGLGLVDVPGRKLGTRFERDDLAQMDSASLIESEKNAEGIKTVNESRKRLGYPKVKGGDTVYRQQQEFSIEALNRRDEAQAAPSSTTQAALPAAPTDETEDDDEQKSARVLAFTAHLLTKSTAIATRNAAVLADLPEAANE